MAFMANGGQSNLQFIWIIELFHQAEIRSFWRLFSLLTIKKWHRGSWKSLSTVDM